VILSSRGSSTQPPLGAIAKTANQLGELFFHYSTDYACDGSGDAPRYEMAATGPLSVYGTTKLEGEDLIRSSGCRYIILGTSWGYPARAHNLIKTMVRLIAEQEMDPPFRAIGSME
jgi:dTDP-4-dehydrorhamnose reductase